MALYSAASFVRERPRGDVEAEPVVKEVEWVSKQLDLPDVDSDPDSD